MTALLTRPKTKGKTKPDAEPKQEKSKSGVRTRVVEVVALGASPRAHLLPPEVLARKRSRILRARLGLGLVGLVVLLACGIGVATVSMLASQSALSDAQTTSSTLLVQQRKYSAVTSVQTDAAAIKLSQKVSTATEVEWAPYIADIQKTLPSGMTITAISALLDAPATSTSAQVAVPLEGPRIGTFSVTVSSAQSSISSWVAKLSTLKGFVDAQPKSVALGEGGKYTAVVDIHIDKGAVSNRFADAK